MTTIKLYRPQERRFAFDADADSPRTEVFQMALANDQVAGKTEEELAELFFHATNAPQEFVDQDEYVIQLTRRLWNNAAKLHKLYTPSTGDVVEVDGTPYLCESFGWKKLESVVVL